MTGNRIRDSKRNPFFQVKVKDGKYSTENQVSYYGKKLPDDTFSFDVSNLKVQANLDEFRNDKTYYIFSRKLSDGK